MTDNVFSTYDLYSDIAANRPANPAPANGRLAVFQATDTGLISIWNGSAWKNLPPATSDLTDVTSGTWTPVLQFGGNSVGITYSIQQASYYAIGKLFTTTFQLNLTSKGTSTGIATIAGLPVLPPLGLNPTFLMGYAINMASVTTSIVVVVANPAGLIYPESTLPNTNLTDANFTNTSDILATLNLPTR